jgi:hypothetical protein
MNVNNKYKYLILISDVTNSKSYQITISKNGICNKNNN